MKIKLLNLLLANVLPGAVVLFVAATSGAIAQTQGPGRALVAADGAPKLSANTVRSGFAVQKQFIVPHPGIVRLKFQYRSDGAGPQTVSVSVTTAIEGINDAVCSVSTTMTTFQAHVCDVKVVAGDRVRVFAQGTFSSMPIGQSTVFIRNVRLHWNVVDAASTGSVLVD
jgi:hypothetical protein